MRPDDERRRQVVRDRVRLKQALQEVRAELERRMAARKAARLAARQPKAAALAGMNGSAKPGSPAS